MRNSITYSLIALSLFVAILVAFEPVQSQLHSILNLGQRFVLAKADSDLTGKGDLATVIKVRTNTELFLEVFLHNEGVVRRLSLPEKRDGFFDFKDIVTNLVLSDLDRDGVLEIITPTFDESLTPRLHVYRYLPDLKNFERVGPDNSDY